MAAMKNLSLEQLGSLGAFTPQHAITPTQQSLLITWNKVQAEDSRPWFETPDILDVYYDPCVDLVVVELFDKKTQECTVVDATTLDPDDWDFPIPF